MRTFFSAAKVAGAGLDLALPARVNMQTILNFIAATNDKASTYISYFKSKLIRTSTASAAAGQKVIGCTTTAGLVASDVCIIQDVVDPTLYEVILIASVAANVSYTTTANLVNSYSAGAKIYGVKIAGGTSVADWIMPVGAATVEKSNATVVFATDKNQAVLLRMDSVTTTCDFFVAGTLRS